MTNIIQNIAGMRNMTEQVIATDFFHTSKTAIKNYAAALADTASPEVRDVLRRQFDAAVKTHEKITNYMMSKGYYNAYNPQEQIKIDLKAADTVLDMQQG